MRKYLLPQNGTGFKANLHCHSTVSDGHWSPERIKEEYKKQGYSIVAYTDHNVMIDHSDLNDEHFLALRGFELDINQNRPGNPPYNRIKCCHMCLIALDPATTRQPYWHRTKYVTGSAEQYIDQVQFDCSLPDCERIYSAEGVSDAMRVGRESGFFVTYNHPMWSMETRDQYLAYEGMHAMEICNFSCLVGGYEDYVPAVYDEMLRSGKRIYCVSTDDNHNIKDGFDSFGGYTVIRADRLDYRTVTRALEKGEFYASMGPEIHDLYYEDGRVYITCSPAQRIMMNTQVRRAKCAWAKEGETLTHASFEVKPDCGYIRLTVMDERGRCANTNAYFLDEI